MKGPDCNAARWPYSNAVISPHRICPKRNSVTKMHEHWFVKATEQCIFELTG